MAKITSCPIELEPKTLSHVQLIQAKEVAAEVVQKLEPREASALFVEGLMHPIKEVRHDMDENGSQVMKLIDFKEKAQVVIPQDEKACHCQCSFPNNENPLKEPLSAPF